MVNRFECDYNNVHTVILHAVSNFYQTYRGNGFKHYRWNGNQITSDVTHAAKKVFKMTCKAIESGRIPTEPLEVTVDLAFRDMICAVIKRIWNITVEETGSGKQYCTVGWHDGPEYHRACSFKVNFDEIPAKPQLAKHVPSETCFSSFWGSPRFADFTINFNGDMYPCHKIVLASRSPVLNDYFIKGTPLNMPKVSTDSIKYFINFLYRDDLALSRFTIPVVATCLFWASALRLKA